jgi:uncharacterized protein (TIGR02996 family)
MNDREALMQTILENPKDDLPRLVFADWQEEHGNALHAELIRVQCELSSRTKGKDPKRKEKLKQREKELVREMGLPKIRGYSSFLAPDKPKYRRGFIDHYRFPCCGNVDGEDGLLDAPPSDSEVEPYLDGILSLQLFFYRGYLGNSAFHKRFLDELSTREYLCRVRSLCFSGVDMDRGFLKRFGSISKLRNVDQILFSGGIPLSSLGDFVLSPNFGPL